MAYQIKSNCARVILHVLAGADKSLVGLTVRNCSIISMTFNELYGIVVHTMGKQEQNRFLSSLFEHYVNAADEEEIAVLEAIEHDDHRDFYEERLIEMLKLYHSGDIYSCYFMSYRYNDRKLTSGGRVRLLKYSHAIGTIPCPYCLTAEKVEKFPIWFDDIYPKLYAQNRSDNFKAMMRAYDRSYLIGITESEYIMLFSILEMIFGSGNSEITYQISRGTALLLSNNADDMLIIYKQMKKL